MIALPHYLDNKLSKKNDKFAQGSIQQSYISATRWQSSLIEKIRHLLSKYLSQTSTFLFLVRVGKQRYFFSSSIKEWKTGLKQDEILAGSSQEEYSKQAPVFCCISHTVVMTRKERRQERMHEYQKVWPEPLTLNA